MSLRSSKCVLICFLTALQIHVVYSILDSQVRTSSSSVESRYQMHSNIPVINRTSAKRKGLFQSVLKSLDKIKMETNTTARIDKAESLKLQLSSNSSLYMSNITREYIQNILTNITNMGVNNCTIEMINNLEELYEEELYWGEFNYTQYRLIETDEQRLLKSLLINYENSVRPVIKASDAVHLRIGITLKQIDIDERNQVLSALVWLDQEWYDDKLIWNPTDYNNLTVLRIPCDLIWLPDVVLYNRIKFLSLPSVEDMRYGYMKALAMVTNDGGVFWPPIVKFKGACEISIKYFPYDDQVCKLKLGSWAYDGNQVTLNKRRQGIDLKNYQPNGEWKLLKTMVVRNEVYYPCCEAPYLDITFTLYLRRRTLYYTYNIVIPCVMLSILTLLCFWMKPDSGEKISMGLTILLAFSVFMLLIAENMPSTSVHVPIIAIYITSSMCITAFSVVVAVFVANIHHQADGEKVVPYWLHKIGFALSKVTCVKMASWEERNFNIKKLALTPGYFLPVVKPKRSHLSKRESVIRNKQQRDKSLTVAEAHIVSQARRNFADSESTDSENDDTLLKRLHLVVEQQEELLRKQSTTEDWHHVAVVIDRCLFWIYLLMMLSITIGCLVIFPMTKDTIPTDVIDN